MLIQEDLKRENIRQVIILVNFNFNLKIKKDIIDIYHFYLYFL